MCTIRSTKKILQTRKDYHLAFSSWYKNYAPPNSSQICSGKCNEFLLHQTAQKLTFLHFFLQSLKRTLFPPKIREIRICTINEIRQSSIDMIEITFIKRKTRGIININTIQTSSLTKLRPHYHHYTWKECSAGVLPYQPRFRRNT